MIEKMTKRYNAPLDSLVEPAQVAVVLRRLDIHLTKHPDNQLGMEAVIFNKCSKMLS